MRKLLICAALLTLSAWADPTDKQVLEFFQRWNTALAGASNFNVLAPMMSRSSIQKISAMDAKGQESVFMMLKMAGLMTASHQWTIDSHRKEQDFLIYKLSYKEKSSRGSIEFPVVEEDGQLKLDYRRQEKGHLK